MSHGRDTVTYNTKIKEESNTVFEKIFDGVYKVHRDRNDKFSGILYVGDSEVIDELNCELKVSIVDINGMVIFKSF